MRNPLSKRYKRELKQDIGKYIALFLFLMCTIGFVSGFLVSDISLKTTYDESFDKYNIEDGHFTLSSKASDDLLNKIQDKDVTVYPLFCKELKNSDKHTVRIYKNRTDVNRVDVMKGTLPNADNEITVDRLYAENNKIKIGDKYTINKRDYIVTGYTAFSDYSALFKNNTDTMFDANKFTVAIMSDDEYNRISDDTIKYTYAWTDNKHEDIKQTRETYDKVKDVIVESGMVTDFLPREKNQAINFTGDDMGSDKAMVEMLLYIIMVILAFIFAVTTKGTIEKESQTIGTLRASGYTKGELIRHYLVLPTFVTGIAAVIGNIMGYTFMKKVMASLYYGSYSLTTYKTHWSFEAFILTTVIPCIIVLVVNVFVISKMMSLKPLKFLRGELRNSGKKKVKKLPNYKFLTRYRIRILTQNVSVYITMFIGILFASVLLIFGSMMNPLLSNYKDTVINTKIAEYQYMLKMPVSIDDKDAEKFSVCELKNDHEDIQVFGIDKNTKYVKDINLSSKNKEVTISNSYSEKYSLKKGDKITLDGKYDDKNYEFIVGGVYDYPPSLSVFMDRDTYNETFELDKDSFSGYFSNKKLTDINKSVIATIVTQDDLTVAADQMVDSMGGVFYLFIVFSMVIFIIIIYLLSKLVIERNAQSISMLKVLGFTNKEAGKLYNNATAISVFISLILALPISYLIIKCIWHKVLLTEMTGYMTFYIAPWIYPFVVAIGMISYLIVHLIGMKRLRNIPMTDALKTIE